MFSWLWVPLQLVAFLESWALSLLVLRLLPPFFWNSRWSGIATNLVIAVGVGIQENFFAWYLADSWSLTNGPVSAFQKIFGGALLGLGILILWVSISAVLKSHRAAIVDLLKNSSRLLRLKSGLSGEVEAAQKTLIEHTQRTLLPKLNEVASLLADLQGAKKAIEELKRLIDSEIRPLSKAFQLASKMNLSGLTHDDLDDLSGLGFPERFNPKTSLRPAISWLLALPFQVNVFVYFFPVGQFGMLMMVFALNLPILILAKLVQRNGDVGRISGIVRVSLISLASIVPEWLVLQTLSHNESQIAGAVLACAFASLCVVWNTLVNAALSSQIEVEKLLQELNERINRELSYFNQSLWLQKRRWGYLLHGSVQASLTVAIARLSQAVQNSTSDELSAEAQATLTLVDSELQKVAQIISNPQTQHLNVSEELEQLRSTWAGVLDIELEISKESDSHLVGDENLAMATNEICREAVTNAYRHGGADSLTINVSVVEAQKILIEIANNGSSPKPFAAGMGHEMMDAVTHEWSLYQDSESKLVVLNAALALPS
jgi:signal transduction histidine kinase